MVPLDQEDPILTVDQEITRNTKSAPLTIAKQLVKIAFLMFYKFWYLRSIKSVRRRLIDSALTDRQTDRQSVSQTDRKSTDRYA